MDSNYLKAVESTIEGFQKGFEKKYPHLQDETLYFMAVLVTQMALNGVMDDSFTEVINATAQNINSVNEFLGEVQR